MQDYKEQQRQKGINFNNAQAAEVAGPIWADMPPPARYKYEEQARKLKQATNVPEMKFTSQGVSIAEIQAQEAERRRAEETEIKEIRNIVKLAAFNNAVQKRNFFLMDLNSFCQVKGRYIVGEVTLLQFNLAEGIRNDYHEVVNPDCVPVGYGSDIKVACEEFGLEYPDSDKPPSNYMHMLAIIIDFLRDQNPDDKAVLPPIFTIPERVEAVNDFIFQLCNIAGADDRLFRVYRIDRLFFELINAIKAHDDEGFPRESLALIQLRKDTFKYNPGLACDMHEAGDKAVECSMSRTKRWVFTILDHCCPVVNIELIPGRHIPLDYDMDKINKYKSETVEKIHNTVAALRQMDCSLNDSNSTAKMSSTLDSSWHTVESGSKKRNVGEAPMQIRRPNLDYSQAIRQPPGIKGDIRAPGVGRGQSSSK